MVYAHGPPGERRVERFYRTDDNLFTWYSAIGIIVPGIPLHIIQRGNNRQACFFADEDYLFYLDWLKELAMLSNCSVHAFVLMTNHVHLLITPQKQTVQAT